MKLTGISGSVTDSFQYDEYGKLTDHTGSSDTPFLYNGQYGIMTDGNGLVYMRARYYNPEVHRFVSTDILEGDLRDPLSLNRYAYCSNNPITYLDPTGYVSFNPGDWLNAHNPGDWLNAHNPGDELNEFNDEYLGGPLNSVNDNYISPFYDPGDTTLGAVESTGKAFGTGLVVKTLIVAPVIGGAGAEKYAQEIIAVENEGAAILSKRDQLLNVAQNTKLRSAINQIYRPGAKIGDGGLADAIRYEQQTGNLLSPNGHLQKGLERIKNLQNIINKENLSPEDLKIAIDLLSDLQNATKGVTP